MVLRGPSLLVEDFNPGDERISPIGRDILGRPFAEVAEETQMAELARTAYEAYRQDSPRYCRRLPTTLTNSDGQTTEAHFNYTIMPSHDSDGNVDGVMIYGEDVSQQMAQEAESWREHLEVMVEHADQIAMALYDAETAELLQASTRYLEILERGYGRPRPDILGRTWQECPFPMPSDEAIECWEQAVKERTTCRLREVRLPIVHDDGESAGVWDCTLTAISGGKDGRQEAVHFVVAAAIEITDQVKLREELQRVDNLKDEFLAFASHELRSPLVPLRGYADLLIRRITEKQHEPGWDRRITEYAAKFDSQLHYLSRLVDDLFDIARLQSDKLALEHAPVDLTKLLERATEQAGLISPGQTFDLQIARTRKPLRVTGDEGRLMQVVMNLLENSAKYAAQSERVDVYLRRIPAGRSGKSEPPKAEIVVRDYGPGVAPEDVQHLFTRFYQAKHENRPARGGLGLGLYIARRIVEQHGGTITVASEVAKGSTFTVLLPLEPA